MDEQIVENLPSFAEFIAQNELFFFAFAGTVSIAAVWLLLIIVRTALHRIFAIPLALNKKIIQIRVPKEGAKKEEEEKSSQKNYKELIAVAEAFYMTLGNVKSRNKLRSFFLGRDDQIALEIVASGGLIKFYAVVPEHLHAFFEQQLHAQYPSAELSVVDDYNIFRPRGVIEIAPLLLTKSWIFPLKSYKKMDSDPLNGLTNALSKVEESQGAAIQIMIRTAKKGWRARGQKVARDMQKGKSLEEAMHGKSMFSWIGKAVFSGQKEKLKEQQEAASSPKLSPFEQELIKAMEEKSSKVGFETNIRILAVADDAHVAKMHLFNITNAFAQYMGPESGINFRKQKYFSASKMIRNALYRNFDEKRVIVLNTEELASLYHMPLSSTETPNIDWLKARSAPPPHNLPSEGIILGETNYRGKKQLVRMLPADRRRHVYVIGMTGVGKSTIMLNMMVQDIRNGHGCCYIDPHGQDLQTILENIPPERADDVILFEPADVERPVGLNMLEASTEEEKDFVAQEMIAIFYRLVTDPSMIGPMFEHYMRNAMLTLMAHPDDPNTIVEIPRILTDKEFQQHMLQKVTDPIIRAFWEKELPQTSGQTKGEMLPYLVSKIGRFIENNMIRNIIGQARSGFNFREIMDKKKILLVNLSKGQIGEMNSNLLGLIIVTKLQMAALARADMHEKDRHDFFLYIDEFQNFITDSIATILSEARKYRLNLILGHQFVAQLMPKAGDTKVRDAVFGNVGSIIAFRVGVDDSEIIAKQMAPVFNEFDVMNIAQRTAYIRLMIDNAAARPFNMATLPPPIGDPKIAAAIRQLSRLKYGRDRSLVEAEILERSKLGGESW